MVHWTVHWTVHWRIYWTVHRRYGIAGCIALEDILDDASEVRNRRYGIGGTESEDTVHRDS